jgi:hypothetical protein
MPSDARRNECALPGEIPKVGFWLILLKNCSRFGPRGGILRAT